MRTSLRLSATLAAVGLVALLMSSAAQAEDKPKGDRVLCAFDSDKELTGIEVSADAKLELVAEHATDGGKSGKLTISKGPYTGIRIKDKALLAGWNEFQFLRMDVFNAGQKAKLEFRIDDDQSTNDWYSWYTGRFDLLPGDNQIEIDLSKLVSPGKRKIDPTKLKVFSFWINPTPATVYLDNLRLAKAEVVNLPAALRAFDFGPTGAAVTPGFTAVDPKTVYSDKTGFGFAPGQTLEGREDLPMVAVPLGKDCVSGPGGKDLVFQVKLDKGDYVVWVCSGWSGTYNWPRAPYRVLIDGKVAFRYECEAGADESFPKDAKPADYLETANFQYRDYWTKVSIWDTFVCGERFGLGDPYLKGPLFDEVEAQINHADGPLEVKLQSNAECRIRGLMIWPKGDKEADAAARKALEDRKKQFASLWREAKPVPKPVPSGPAPKPSEQEQAVNTWLRTRNYLEPVTPYLQLWETAPLEKLSIAAAPGQYEPAVFIAIPMKDGEAAVTVSDLDGPSGAKIPSTAVQVNYVHYRYCAEEGLGTSRGVYTVQPSHLVPLNKLKLETNVPRQFWLIAHVPDDAAPGKYAGTVKVAVGDKSASIPMEIEVYPFRLDKLADHGYTFAHVTSVYDDPRRMENDLRAYAEHGCNSVTPGGAIGWEVKRVDGKLVFDFHRLDQLMDLMKKAGMTGPVPLFDMSVQGSGGGKSYPHMGFLSLFKYKLDSQQYFDDLTELTRQIVERAKEKDYLPVIMYPSTEISNDESVGPAFNSKLIAAMRKASSKRVECISSVNRPADIATAAELDHIMINYGVGLTQETLDRIKKSGAKLWFQNVGQTRYTDGLMMLRCGAVGRRQWVGTWYSGDPYNDWDGAEASNMLFPSKLGSLPTVAFEWMRAGMYDLRYFITLRRLIDEGLKSDSPDTVRAARAAKADYDKMIDSCPVNLPENAEVQRDGLSASWGFADKTTFDKYRLTAAEHLAKLWPMVQKK